MIYIHRDWGIVPVNVKEGLQNAADELEKIADLDARKAYIKANVAKWSSVREYLGRMSHNKCWYSEATESVSRYQVDHFRPHGRAKQAVKTFEEGYSWLAFDCDNFRLAGMLCNTANQEYSDETIGKADWFPLVDSQMRARLSARDCRAETPILLDPVEPDDPGKLIFNDDGSIAPAPELDENIQAEVEFSIKCLGLQQNLLKIARGKVWLKCLRTIKKYNLIAVKRKGARSVEESAILRGFQEELVSMSKASSEFAAVARCCLTANGLTQLVVRDELLPLSVD